MPKTFIKKRTPKQYRAINGAKLWIDHQALVHVAAAGDTQTFCEDELVIMVEFDKPAAHENDMCSACWHSDDIVEEDATLYG